ncbi:MAG TPA: hypothetical protein VJV05_10830, partial [Pyrinomonadaceae bacterium]|nr:hypothetical protein [Pyrinomonadaceae bacterium]
MRLEFYLTERGRFSMLGILSMVTLLLLVPSSASGATLTVTNTTDSGAGSFRQALADALNGDTINFNLSGCPCSIELESRLITVKDLTIVGPGPNLLVLDVTSVFGDVFDNSSLITGGIVTIENLTFANARGGTGRGINNTGNLTIRNVVVRD